MTKDEAMVPKQLAIEGSNTDAEIRDTSLRRFVGYNLKRAYMTLHSDLAANLAVLDLRSATFSALALVVENPDISQTRLSLKLKIERSNLVLIVDELEGRELITRNKVAGDRRSYALRATLSGVKLRDAAIKAITEHENRLMADLSQEQRQMLVALLDKIEHPSLAAPETQS